MVDHSMMKLGRKAVKTDSRTLCLARYMTPALPAPPPAVDWTKGKTSFGMMLNNALGDCTIAGVAHAIQILTLNAAAEVTPPDDVVQSYYEQWDGYNPADPETDKGGVELDVLNKWRTQGFAGHELLAFADPNVANGEEIRQSIALFGGVYIGLSLPMSAQTQDVWDVAPDPGDGSTQAGSWGGHCVFVAGYDQKGFTCITWGELKKITTAFWQKYCDEAHALLSPDWLTANGAPSGFNLQQLQADLAAIE